MLVFDHRNAVINEPPVRPSQKFSECCWIKCICNSESQMQLKSIVLFTESYRQVKLTGGVFPMEIPLILLQLHIWWKNWWWWKINLGFHLTFGRECLFMYSWNKYIRRRVQNVYTDSTFFNSASTFSLVFTWLFVNFILALLIKVLLIKKTCTWF